MMIKYPQSEKSSAILGVGFSVILRGIGVGIRENPGAAHVSPKRSAVLVGSLRAHDRKRGDNFCPERFCPKRNCSKNRRNCGKKFLM